MAIPTGTTARQLSAVAQWVLAAVLITGMLAGWSPGFYNWGVMMTGLAISFTLMLIWRVLCNERGFAGNRIYLPVACVAAVLIGHVVYTALGRTPAEGGALAGSLNISMLMQWVLLAMAVLVTQNLMVQTKFLRIVIAACGTGMIVGSLAAIQLGHADEIHDSLALLGFAGAAVMLAPLWMEQMQQKPPGAEVGGSAGGGMADSSEHAAAESSVSLWQRRMFRRVWLAMAASIAIVMAILSPDVAFIVLLVLAMVLLLGAAMFAGRRVKLLLMAVGAVALAAGWWWAAGLISGGDLFPAFRPWLPPRLSENVSLVAGDVVGWFGCGEEAFARRGLWAGSAGLSIIAAASGWAGLLAVTLGLSAAWLVYFLQARKAEIGDQPRVIAWLLACACCTMAMLWRGGLFIPIFTLACAFAWGLTPAMLAVAAPRRKGSSLLIVMICMTILLGLARNDGMLGWSVSRLGGNDKLLHAAVCFLASLTVAWHVGARKHWLAMVGIMAVVAAGGAGEFVQKVASTRSMDLVDWFYDVAGSAAAAAIYLLVVSSRLCESPDAKAVRIENPY